MAHDLYARPPRSEPPTGMTRRALLGLRPPAPGLPVDYERTDGMRRAIRSAWARPDAARLLRAIEPASEALAELVRVRPGDRVLTLDCSNGVGRLPYGDASFDVVMSNFAAALDPEPTRAVAELVRVTAPGGRVGLTAWIPRGLPGRLPEFAEAIRPLPAGVPSPREWGREPVARAHLGSVLDELDVRTRTVRLTFSSADAAFAILVAPLELDVDERGRLRPSFDRLLASCNDSLDGVEFPGRYLAAVGRRPPDPSGLGD